MHPVAGLQLEVPYFTLLHLIEIYFDDLGVAVPDPDDALRAVRKGGVVVCGGIHMSDIPSFPYADLWGERQIRSVANLTREDGRRLLEVAPKVPIRTQVACYRRSAGRKHRRRGCRADLEWNRMTEREQ